MDGFIHTDDHVSLRYTERGAGRPVVFVHGWQGAAEQWRSAAQVLAGECRTVTYDQRGHGRSHDAPCGWTVHRLAHDLAQLLERLALTDAVLVGHSMGCSVIWAYLELFGAARLERLVLVFEPDEGGSHLLALENPAKFNQLLREFLADVPSSADSRLSPPDPTPSIEPEGATT